MSFEVGAGIRSSRYRKFELIYIFKLNYFKFIYKNESEVRVVKILNYYLFIIYLGI